jgi:hypothetical protein
MCATSVIFQKLPKVNNRPTCEKLPNRVTLHSFHFYLFLRLFVPRQARPNREEGQPDSNSLTHANPKSPQTKKKLFRIFFREISD